MERLIRRGCYVSQLMRDKPVSGLGRCASDLSYVPRICPPTRSYLSRLTRAIQISIGKYLLIWQRTQQYIQSMSNEGGRNQNIVFHCKYNVTSFVKVIKTKFTSDMWSPVPALLQRSLWQLSQNKWSYWICIYVCGPDEYIDIREGREKKKALLVVFYY